MGSAYRTLEKDQQLFTNNWHAASAYNTLKNLATFHKKYLFF